MKLKLLTGLLMFLLSSSVFAGSQYNPTPYNIKFTPSADVTQSLPALPLAGGTMTGNIIFNSSSSPLGLSFTGVSGANQITLTSNLANALKIADSTYNYATYVSSIGRPRITSNAEYVAGAQITDAYGFNIPGLIYNSNASLSASQSGTTVTGTSTNFTAAMTGGFIYWPSTGNAAIIQTVNSTTSLTVDVSQTQSSAPFQIYYGGMNIDYNGIRQFQNQINWINNLDTPPSATGASTTLNIGQNNATGVTIYQPLSMNSKRISNVLDPASAQDAATKNYADTNFLAAKSATVTISSSSYNASHTTPVTIVSSQGSGVLIVPLYFTVEVINGSTQFSGHANVYFQYGTSNSTVNTATNLIYSEAVTTFAANTKYMYTIHGQIGSDIGGGVWYNNQLPNVTNLTNQPLTLSATATGTGNGSLVITCYYTTMTPT